MVPNSLDFAVRRRVKDNAVVFHPHGFGHRAAMVTGCDIDSDFRIGEPFTGGDRTQNADKALVAREGSEGRRNVATAGTTPDIGLPLGPRLAIVMQPRQYSEAGNLGIVEPNKLFEARTPLDQGIKRKRYVRAVSDEAAACNLVMTLTCLGYEGQCRLPLIPVLGL